MATVTTNFSSASSLDTGMNAAFSGYTLADGLVYGMAAYDYSNYYDFQSYSATSSTHVAGILTNGDLASGFGSNLTGYPYTVTRLDYTFVGQGITASLIGAVSQASAVASNTGYINQVVVSSVPYGSITINGYDNVALAGDGTISSVTRNVNGATLTASGALTGYVFVGSDGFYHASVTGAYTSATLSYAGQTMQFSGIAVDANSQFATADSLLTSVLSGNDVVNGASGNDFLSSYAGNDTLSGGAGADTMVGGTGNDTYAVDNTGDVVTENAGEGTADVVQSSIAYALGANVENLTLTGAGNINGAGNTLNNIITGNNGNNVLEGGAGDDTLNGGLGTDAASYAAAGAGVTVSLAILTGQNTIGAGADTLSGIENLTGSAFNDTLTGDGAGNVLNGGAGADTLIGGAGADAMIGGTGNDTYTVDNGGDVAAENFGEGTDTVRSSVTWTLGSYLENLVLTGSANINGTGNGLNNVLAANNGINTLDGGAGTDTANFSAFSSGVLANLTFIGSQGYSFSGGTWHAATTLVSIENLTGSANNDWLIGNSGNNVFAHTGGVDYYEGGAGTDTADFSADGGGVLANLNYAGVQAFAFSGGIWNAAATLVGVENLIGSASNDWLIGDGANNVFVHAGGVDYYEGGAGTDTADFSADSLGVLVNLTYAGVQAFAYANGIWNSAATLVSIENLTGTAGNDWLIGDGADNVLVYKGGVDYLEGSGGTDTADFSGSSLAMVANLTYAGTQAYTLSGGVWTVAGSLVSIENLTGTGLGDFLSGDGNANRIDGGAGVDTLQGGGANDVMVFYRSQANGDVIMDFNGNGAGAGDALEFAGYGTAAQGASFTQVNASTWSINSSDGLVHDLVTLANAASVDLSDYLFV